MPLLLFFAVVLVGAVFYHRKVRSGPSSLLVLVMSLATIVVAAMNWMESFRPTYERDKANSPGQRLGAAIKRDLKGGAVLVIRMSPAVAGPRDEMNTLLSDLKKSFKGTPFTLVGLEDTPAVTNAWTRVFTSSKPDAGLYETYLSSFPGVVALASLSGLPHCRPDQLPQPLPPFYVFGTRRDQTNADWKACAALKEIVTIPDF